MVDMTTAVEASSSARIVNGGPEYLGTFGVLDGVTVEEEVYPEEYDDFTDEVYPEERYLQAIGTITQHGTYSDQYDSQRHAADPTLRLRAPSYPSYSVEVESIRVILGAPSRG